MTYDPSRIALGLKTIKHIEGNRSTCAASDADRAAKPKEIDP